MSRFKKAFSLLELLLALVLLGIVLANFLQNSYFKEYKNTQELVIPHFKLLENVSLCNSLGKDYIYLSSFSTPLPPLVLELQ